MSRAEFEANMAGKMKDPTFHGDIEPLLVPGAFQADPPSYDRDAAYRRVHEAFIARVPGEPWKGVQ